jgi:hypothetical protein
VWTIYDVRSVWDACFGWFNPAHQTRLYGRPYRALGLRLTGQIMFSFVSQWRTSNVRRFDSLDPRLLKAQIPFPSANLWKIIYQLYGNKQYKYLSFSDDSWKKHSTLSSPLFSYIQYIFVYTSNIDLTIRTFHPQRMLFHQWFTPRTYSYKLSWTRNPQ